MILRSLRLVLRSSPRWSVLSALCVLGCAAAPLLTLWSVGRLVDAALDVFNAQQAALGPLLPWLALFAAATALDMMLNELRTCAAQHLSERLTALLQADIQRQLATIDYQERLDPRFQSATFHALTGSQAWPRAIFFSALTVCQAALTFLALALLLAQAAWWLPFAVAAAGAPLLAVRLMAERQGYELHERLTGDERRMHYYNRVLTRPEYAAEARLFALLPTFRRLYEERRERVAMGRLRQATRAALWSGLAVTLTALLVAGVFLALVVLTATGGLSVGLFAMHLLGVRRAQVAALSLARAAAALKGHALHVRQLFQLLDVTLPIKTRHFPGQWRTLRFDRVSFSYPDSQRQALNDVSFEVRRGEVVALRGANGSGKSTVVRLLLALLRPDRGSVAIEGVPVADIDPAELRAHVTCLFQDFRIYSLTAADNIALGRPGQTARDDVALRRAAREAGIEELLDRLPQGFDTLLGNNFPGSEMFSRGEWQRLALARVLYSSAELIVLDEPASALDSGARGMLREALAAMRTSGATVLMVTHDDDLAGMADRSIVLG